jgi:hypothetical protein
MENDDDKTKSEYVLRRELGQHAEEWRASLADAEAEVIASMKVNAEEAQAAKVDKVPPFVVPDGDDRALYERLFRTQEVIRLLEQAIKAGAA